MTTSLITIPTDTGQRLETKGGRTVGTIDYNVTTRRFDVALLSISKRREGFRKLEAAQYWALAEYIESAAYTDEVYASLTEKE